MIAGLDIHRLADAIFINSPLKNYDVVTRYNSNTLPVLGLGYIATYAQKEKFNVGILDAEAGGIGISQVASLINQAGPRWVGLNLLAPTYIHSINILQRINPDIAIMLGGHLTKAMPQEILRDPHIPRIDALILGEGEYRVAEILRDIARREKLPGLYWRDSQDSVYKGSAPSKSATRYWLTPDINSLPFINRNFFVQDPFKAEDGLFESSMIGSRGCPYNCSFCSAAASVNPDVVVRTRNPENIIEEMEQIAGLYGVSAFRFVDDLFLSSIPFMKRNLQLFIMRDIGKKYVWDATGRINALDAASSELLDQLEESGCREISLGIESGNERILRYIGKQVTPEMTLKVVEAVIKRGINIKGYFILGFPTESVHEIQDTIRQIRQLWEISDKNPGTFRCSIFEFRPYPGTPEWHRLVATGLYKTDELLGYQHVDLTRKGLKDEVLERDEFSFSVNIQFGEMPVRGIRKQLTELMTEQKLRLGTKHNSSTR